MKPLSWDHVPPKGGINLTSVEVNNLYEFYTAGKQNGWVSQNGVKYRTICVDCNSKIGSEFDPVLNQLNRSLINIIQPDNPTWVANPVKIRTKPVRLMKAVLAHLLSAKMHIDEVVTDKNMREMLLLVNQSIPEDLHIHYWFFPYDTTVIMRDFALPVVPGNFSVCTFAHMIKYFPLAFIVTDSDTFRGLTTLSQYRNLDIDQEVDIEIYLDNVKDFDWPEKVDESNILFLSAESANAIYARRKQ
ncbi:hypothetical protein FMM05_08580 [Flavobacterium zepuense]|uniref:Uncharacterized protein n=1 Tax=Flavobacterium zepuense TaxID=2593302 RepID=A0A552V4I3_9FLAO|nr:hypothetical protein [Flavobacterium zepuense]TRW25349.1 hypothetical protein FMM05_08580 [Flavobacterium zepuense]